MKDEKLLAEIRKKFKAAQDAEADMRAQWLSDMEFAHVPGSQWPSEVRSIRENPTSPRPCLEINVTAQHVYQVTNDVRQNRPTVKVRPVSMDADNDVADVYDGIIRHIDACSDADVATDVAVVGQVTGGYGYFRIVTEYTDKDSNKQEIYERPVYNPLSVCLDPSSMCPVGSDAKWGFVADEMRRADFEEKYGKDAGTWSEDSETAGWVTKDTVRIVEFFEVVEEKKNILKLINNQKVTETDYWTQYEGDQSRPSVASNETEVRKYVKWRKCTSFKVLEETEFPSQYIPIIRVPGLVIDVDGKRYFKGLVRDAKDPQRTYNYEWSLHIETGALQPKVPFIVAEGQIEDYEEDWRRANSANLPFLKYKQTDVDGTPAPPPQRQQLQMTPQGTLQGLMMANDAIKMVTGQYDASLGQKSNETSGKAILARQREGDTATYHYVDNLSMAIRHKGRILIDMIPRVYDTARVLRILGEDGSTGEARIDPSQQEPMREVRGRNGAIQKIFNLNVGKYDVVSTVGPSYTTKRQEAVDAMSQILQSNPQLFSVIGDIFVRSQDWPNSDEMADRLKIMLPPQIQQAEAQEGQQPLPPQVQQQMMQMQQQTQQMQQVIQQLQQELQQAKQGNDAKIQSAQISAEASLMEAKIQADTDYKIAELQMQNKQRIAAMEMQNKLLMEASKPPENQSPPSAGFFSP